MTSPLPDAAGLGDTGHVADHNLMVAAIASKAEQSTVDSLTTTVAGKLDTTSATATYAAKAGATYTGTHNFTGATVTGTGGGTDLGYFNVKDYGAVGDGTTDDSVAIQAALSAATAAGGGHVFVPAGVYAYYGFGGTADEKKYNGYRIGSNTKLELDARATMKRMEPNTAGGWLTNDSDGTVGLFGANSNIEVCGGTWDAQGGTLAGNTTILNFSHVTNLHIHDVHLTRNNASHHIEINAAKNVLIDNVRCSEMFSPGQFTEAIQFDIADTNNFKQFGPYDLTPCEDVKIINCVFRNVTRAIGSHAGASDVSQRNILIDGCYFDNDPGYVSDQHSIYGFNWTRVTITNCHFATTHGGIYIFNGHNGARSDFHIADNIILPATLPAVHLTAGGSPSMTDVVISGNRLSAVTIGVVSRTVLAGNVINAAVVTDGANTVDLKATGNFIAGAWAGPVLGSGVDTVAKVTQAAYDALGTKVATTLYVIV